MILWILTIINVIAIIINLLCMKRENELLNKIIARLDDENRNAN